MWCSKHWPASGALWYCFNPFWWCSGNIIYLYNLKSLEKGARLTKPLKKDYDQQCRYIPFGGSRCINRSLFITLVETEPYWWLFHLIDFIAPIVDINLTGTISGTSLAILHFKQQMRQEFNIINISSAAALTHFPSRSVYSATKAGVRTYIFQLLFFFVWTNNNLRFCTLVKIWDIWKAKTFG